MGYSDGRVDTACMHADDGDDGTTASKLLHPLLLCPWHHVRSVNILPLELLLLCTGSQQEKSEGKLRRVFERSDPPKTHATTGVCRLRADVETVRRKLLAVVCGASVESSHVRSRDGELHDMHNIDHDLGDTTYYRTRHHTTHHTSRPIVPPPLTHSIADQPFILHSRTRSTFAFSLSPRSTSLLTRLSLSALRYSSPLAHLSLPPRHG